MPILLCIHNVVLFIYKMTYENEDTMNKTV